MQIFQVLSVLSLLLWLPTTAAEPQINKSKPEHETPILKWIADNVETALLTTDKLTFEADLVRTYTGGQYHYKAVVDMKEGEVYTKVYDASDPKKLIAEVTGTIADVNKQPIVDQKDYVEDGDHCLFGSLTVPWIGEKSDPPSFVKRIISGTLIGMVQEDGQWCYKITNHRTFEFTGPKNINTNRQLTFTFLVDANSFRVLRWDTQQKDTPEHKEGPNFVVVRSYRYLSHVTHERTTNED